MEMNVYVFFWVHVHNGFRLLVGDVFGKRPIINFNWSIIVEISVLQTRILGLLCDRVQEQYTHSLISSALQKQAICRELNALPGAFYRAPGKGFLCRRPEPDPPGLVMAPLSPALFPPSLRSEQRPRAEAQPYANGRLLHIDVYIT